METIHVVKIGGKVAESDEFLDSFLQSFTQLTSKKVLVHGGGITATKIGKKLGIEAKMIDGRRVTDTGMLDVVTMVYGGLVNKKLVAQLQAQKINAIGLTGADLNVIRSERRPAEPIDFGFVGDIDKVDAEALVGLLDKEVVPVLAPLTHDGNGSMLNTNADAIASFVARALAEHSNVELSLCFDRPGVMHDGRLISIMNWDFYQVLKNQKVITDGMIPKLDLGFDAIRAGVKRVNITQF
ncbi:MAG: acetylglutamate kinase, partial [Balneolales bacterium]|nr:acetylglutamate kinase [Balneolales bacterium]